MCAKAAPMPPPPAAPPAPIPKTDTVLEARGNRQRAAARGAESGYQATMLTEARDSGGGVAPVAAAVLGG